METRLIITALAMNILRFIRELDQKGVIDQLYGEKRRATLH